MTERYCEGERFTGLSFAGEAFESCDFADCVFVDCSFTKCELDHTMLNESSAREPVTLSIDGKILNGGKRFNAGFL